MRESRCSISRRYTGSSVIRVMLCCTCISQAKISSDGSRSVGVSKRFDAVGPAAPSALKLVSALLFDAFTMTLRSQDRWFQSDWDSHLGILILKNLLPEICVTFAGGLPDLCVMDVAMKQGVAIRVALSTRMIAMYGANVSVQRGTDRRIGADGGHTVAPWTLRGARLTSITQLRS